VLHPFDARGGSQSRAGSDHDEHWLAKLRRPSFGSWSLYGLGSESENLPGYIVLASGKGTSGGASNYGCGFLPTTFAGTPLRGTGDPILYLSNPKGVDAAAQRASLDTLRGLNDLALGQRHDPETAARIHSYEMAYRLQSSAPELMDLGGEPQHILDLYGIKDVNESNYARNCLLARRLIERGVLFVQLFHEAWDQHTALTKDLRTNCAATDRASAALVTDLKQRGLLDDTIVIWGASLAARPWCRGAMMDAITTTAASLCGWPAAASNGATATARPMTLASMSCAIPFTCTTSTPRCCTNSVSITRNLPTVSKAVTSGSPTCMGTW